MAFPTVRSVQHNTFPAIVLQKKAIKADDQQPVTNSQATNSDLNSSDAIMKTNNSFTPNGQMGRIIQGVVTCTSSVDILILCFNIIYYALVAAGHSQSLGELSDPVLQYHLLRPCCCRTFSESGRVV